MSSFNLGKKLKPASKAWKNITKTLLNLSKAVKRKTHRQQKIRHEFHSHCRSSSYNGKSSPAIYVDQLYDRPVPLQVNRQVIPKKGTTSKASDDTNNEDIIFDPKGKKLEITDTKTGKFDETNPKTLADAWNNISLSSLPKLHGNIDEKAEEFISKFREDMKMQKEKSFLDFQEMLARSS